MGTFAMVLLFVGILVAGVVRAKQIDEEDNNG